MEAFTIIALTLAAFLLSIGVFFVWTSFKINPEGPISPKVILLCFALLYIGLSHFSIYLGMAYAVELTNRAPCENVVSNSTEVTSAVTVYQYEDSCDERTTPRSVERLFGAYGWLLLIDMIAIGVGLFLVGMRRLLFKW